MNLYNTSTSTSGSVVGRGMGLIMENEKVFDDVGQYYILAYPRHYYYLWLSTHRDLDRI